MSQTSSLGMARAVYVLHLVGLITGGLTAVAGVIIAHLHAGDAPPPCVSTSASNTVPSGSACSTASLPASPPWPLSAGC